MAVVHVPPGEATRIAQQLLGWAADRGMDPGVVKTSSDGLFGFSFVVPDELIEGYTADMGDVVAVPKQVDPAPEEPAPKPAKKAAKKAVKKAAEPVVEEQE